MGLLRWLLWPRRRRRDEDEEEPGRRRRRRAHGDPGVYRIEVDQEARRFRGGGPPFSFWASSRIILILALLLWWIQPAGPMIAGYVGGRRAGSPWKAVTAALLPVFIILLANYTYAHNVATRQIDFVASLPVAMGDGAAAILPFLAPYKDFMVAYLHGFVEALRTTFGMGTNGYLMVVIFSYIGGLIAEQTRRELYFRGASSTSVGVNLLSPFLHPRGWREPDEAEEAEDEAPEDHPHRSRRPTRAHAKAVHAGGRVHRRRGSPGRFEEFRKVPAEALDARGERRAVHGHRHPAREAEDEEDAEDAEAEERRVHTKPHHPAKASNGRARGAHASAAPEDSDEPARREVREKRPSRPRTHEEEVAIQRFVERALRAYDHSRL